MTKELLQQALDALEYKGYGTKARTLKKQSAISALREALTQPVPMRKTTREEKITRPGVYEVPMAPATLSTAPTYLNINDKAMWVLGWNECLNAALNTKDES